MSFLRNYRTVCSLTLNDDLLSTAVAKKTVYRQLCVFGKLSSSGNSLHFHTHTLVYQRKTYFVTLAIGQWISK